MMAQVRYQSPQTKSKLCGVLRMPPLRRKMNSDSRMDDGQSSGSSNVPLLKGITTGLCSRSSVGHVSAGRSP